MSQENTNSLQTDAEIVDLEEYAKQGKTPPKNRRYRVRVNKEMIIFDNPTPTREEILEKANLTPTNQWTLRLKIRGGHQLIAEGEQVDLTAPGIEKFKALPRDQTEG